MPLAQLPRPINRSSPGYGATDELPIAGTTTPTDTSKAGINQWLHTQPWFQNALKSWGVDPNDIHLSIQQRSQIKDALTRAGISGAGVTDVAHAGIDPNGNIEDDAMPTWTKIALIGFGAAAGGAALGLYGGAGAGGAGYVGADVAATAAATSAGIPAIAGTAAGAGTAATAAKAGSWLTSPAASLISTGVQAGAGIYAANKQADASAEAARIQAESFDKALAAQREEQSYQHSRDQLSTNQYGAYLSRLDPYARTGQQASNRLSEFMGQPAEARTPLPQPMPVPPASAITTLPPPPVTPAPLSVADLNATWAQTLEGIRAEQARQTASGGASVLMRAPDGSTRMVPTAQVSAAESAGAQRVA